ncbi:MAG: M48 family metallopeptidase [Oscillospiraceae bacterium]|jgi:predicted metal-dependent hydrolase
MKQHIQILNREIEFELVQKNVKNINLRIKPGGIVSVSVPLNTPSSVIENFMQSNAARILEAVDRLSDVQSETKKRKQPELPLLQNGDTIYILGEACRLRVCKSNETRVIRDGSVINVYVLQNKDMQQVQVALDKWRDHICHTTVTAICKSIYPVFQTLGVKYPNEIRLRKMSASWGNCRPDLGILTFSKNLIEVPSSCIEFVVQHEFTHFLYPDHSKEFYATMDAVAPRWREAERLLRKYEHGKMQKNRGSE